MIRNRDFFSSLFLYVSVISIAMIGIILGLMGGAALTVIASGAAVVKESEVGIFQPAQTTLDLRMQNLREVQQALARPVSSPEPLPPLTARRIPSAAHRVGHVIVATKVGHRKSMTEARKAFAHIEPVEADVRSSAYAEPDRHSIR